MARSVYCQILKQDAEGLDQPPHPGSLGQRVYDNVHMVGFLFGEGDMGKLPAGFSPAGQKK
jgi:hypothetical protein